MGEDGWKSNLNAQQQQKVSQMEKNAEILKKELEKKTMSCDILQQTMEKEKRKVDEEKSNTSQIQKELVSLREKMEESEKKTEKLIHEMTAKEQLNINLQVRWKKKNILIFKTCFIFRIALNWCFPVHKKAVSSRNHLQFVLYLISQNTYI